MNIPAAADSPAILCSHTELRDPAALVEHPRNPNRHPRKQIELLARIIRHQGWGNPIVVSARSGFVVAGHGRLAAARLLGLAGVPVDVQDFGTEADEWAHLVADNRIAELADMDDARTGAWQERKRAWIEAGIAREEGRADELAFCDFAAGRDENGWRCAGGRLETPKIGPGDHRLMEGPG